MHLLLLQAHIRYQSLSLPGVKQSWLWFQSLYKDHTPILYRSIRQNYGPPYKDYTPEAIEDAKVNSAINGIDNTLFYAGDMKDILTQEFINQHGRPDVIITDPPRAGMHDDVINTILFAEPQRIVYVSCNPATQARDLSLLDAKYKVMAVQPVDMFPHTHHVENVVLLEKRG